MCVIQCGLYGDKRHTGMKLLTFFLSYGVDFSGKGDRGEKGFES